VASRVDRLAHPYRFRSFEIFGPRARCNAASRQPLAPLPMPLPFTATLYRRRSGLLSATITITTITITNKITDEIAEEILFGETDLLIF
jgi:hypothetical protein